MNGKTGSKTEIIQLPKFTQAAVQITVRGRTALITNAFSEQDFLKIEEGQKGDKAIGKKERQGRDPQTEYLGKIYRTSDGRPGFPANGIKRSMVTAGGRFTDAVSTRLRGFFTIPDEIVPIISPYQPRMRRDRVRLSDMKRTTSVAYRPEFLQWSMEIPFVYSEQHIDAQGLANLLAFAGSLVGIGDWRPECNGNFGMFDVVGMRTLLMNGAGAGDEIEEGMAAD